MDKTDQKIDELAQMVARGFQELHSEIGEMRGEINEMRTEMATKTDIDKALGIVRADYDSLATHVKDLEKMAS